MEIRFKKLTDSATIPTYGGGDSANAGLDLYSSSEMDITIPAGRFAIIPTGIAWEPIAGSRCVMIVQSRSGMAFKHNIEASNAGVIDSTYRGEISVKLYNTGDSDYIVHKGDRIAQGIVMILPEIREIVEMVELGDTIRGDSGFGSTGR